MKLLSTICLLAVCSAGFAQPRYDMKNIMMEKLNRGVVATKSNGKVAVSWRLLSEDGKNAAFDVYRNGKKLNSKALKKGGTFFVDEQPVSGDATYEVRGAAAMARSVLRLMPKRVLSLFRFRSLPILLCLMAECALIAPTTARWQM